MTNSTTRAIVASAALLLGSVHASAATVENVSGSVFVNRGKGFVAVTGGTQVKTGDVVMVRDGGEALVVYTDGCQARVKPTESITVTEASPCSLVDHSSLKPGVPAPGTLLIGAAVVAGGVGAAIALSGGDDSKTTPASPASP